MKPTIGLLSGWTRKMARPLKIEEKTKTYNLLMTVSQYDKLATLSEERQKTELEQVSVADLIREAIDLYIHVIEQEEEDEKTGTEG